jgi:DNA-directed RNA polymerase specialized sigma24 family protein
MDRPPPTSGSLASLSEEDWHVLWCKLLLHVYNRYRWFYLRTGRSLEGLAAEAMLAMISGRRRYPPIDKKTGLERQDVTPLAFLCETVYSLVSRRLPDSISLDDLDRLAPFLDLRAKSYLFTPAHIEERLTYQQIVTKMLKLVHDDPLAQQILLLLSEDSNLRPREIAELLGLPINKIRAAQKRLRRRLAQFRRNDDE